MKISLREQILIGVVMVVLITVIFGIFLWKPQYEKIGDLKKRQKKEQVAYQKKLAELRTLKIAKEEAPEIEANSIQLSKKMPEEAEFPTTIVEIQEIANESGVKFFAIKSDQEEVQKDYYAEIPLELVLKGTFFDLADFLYQLEKLSREIKVDKLEMEVDEESDYPVLSVKLEGRIFRYTPGETAAKDTQNTQGTQGQGNSQKNGKQ